MKPKASKAPARKSKTDNYGSQRHEMVRLESIPIADPWHEKRMFEEGEFARKLNPDFAGAIIIQNEHTNQIRICEVYRLCSELAQANYPGSHCGVIRDFAAHFPDLMFAAEWIKELVRRESVESRFSKSQREVLGAIQTGLRSAVNSQPREPAASKYYRASAAQMVAKDTIGPEISKWNKSLERDSAPLPEWIAQQAAQKVHELMRTYGLRGRAAQERLTRYLEQGRCYKAAILIASLIFKVPEHDLESSLK